MTLQQFFDELQVQMHDEARSWPLVIFVEMGDERFELREVSGLSLDESPATIYCHKEDEDDQETL